MRITRNMLGIAAIAVLALTVRFIYWHEIRGTPLDVWHLWDQTDMATYLKQAERLAAGDWLGRSPYQPYHVWQQAAGSEQDWLRWYPRATFHQAPLYSYLLAIASRLTASYIGLVKLLQILLGAASCLLIAAIARRVGGDAVGLVAGLIAALYGPLFYLEPQVLREGPAIFGFALLLRMLVEHVSGEPNAASRWWLGPASIGFLLGVYAMFYEISSVLAVGALIVVGVHAGMRARRETVRAIGVLALGWLVGFAPLLVRNLAVGASPLGTSSRLAVNLAYANMPTATEGGAYFTEPGPQLKQIMDASGGSIRGILREVWRSYEGKRWQLPRNLLRRFATVWADVELPDNTSFAFYRREVPVLRKSLSFAWVFAPAAAAIILLSLPAMRRRMAKGWNEHRAAHFVLLAFVPLLAAAMTAVLPQARYRLFIVPVLIVYAALLVVLVYEWARRVWVGLLAGVAILVVALVLLQRVVSAPLRSIVDRPIDYIVAARISLAAGDVEAAARYYRGGIETHPRDARLHLELSNALAQAGRYAAAIEQLEKAVEIQPDLPGAREAIGKLREMEASRPTETPR
jgi:4-amino-4-deoxy-L-arabinose transferase-like glycosyltransferase